ncbi:hypothetical protein [Actibacterium sp. MT2.3-13A]|uniref:hypothetical protein n=1 Tax=Actibacterium sp. MT2.3-13A TaxID=2828332 RepID=UPI001BAA257C|nr:hypothetical protein [Actibacterium sp. MT2.3-13A]
MAAATFTEAQVRRAVKGALAAGLPIGEVKIDPDGTIRILPAAEEKAQSDQREPESW